MSTTPLEPYTLAKHFKRCYDKAGNRLQFDQFVQVQVSRVTQCARIRDAWSTNDGLDMWSLELLGPLKGHASFPCHKTVQCSGLDGHCGCAGESANLFNALAVGAESAMTLNSAFLAVREAGCFSQAGVVAPPESPDFGISVNLR